MSWTGKWISQVRNKIPIYWYLMKQVPRIGYIGIALHEGIIFGGLLTIPRITDLDDMDTKIPHGYKIDDPKDKRTAIVNIFEEVE